MKVYWEQVGFIPIMLYGSENFPITPYLQTKEKKSMNISIDGRNTEETYRKPHSYWCYVRIHSHKK